MLSYNVPMYDLLTDIFIKYCEIQTGLGIYTFVFMYILNLHGRCKFKIYNVSTSRRQPIQQDMNDSIRCDQTVCTFNYHVCFLKVPICVNVDVSLSMYSILKLFNVMQELEEIYIDTSNTVNIAMESHALMLLTKVRKTTLTKR